jgi:hypothetical protein
MAKFNGLPVSETDFPNFYSAGGRTANATTYESPENPVERPLNQSHYVKIDFFDSAGKYLWTSTLSTQDTLGAAMKAGTLVEILQAAFNAPMARRPNG